MALYRDVLYEQESSNLRMQAAATKDKIIEKFTDAYIDAGNSPGTAMRKARDAASTPVKMQKLE